MRFRCDCRSLFILPAVLLLWSTAWAQVDDAASTTGSAQSDEASSASATSSQPTWPVPRFGVSAVLPEGVDLGEAQKLEVMLGIAIDATGEVVGVEIRESSGLEEVDFAAERAAWSMLFAPSTVDGVPIEVTIDYPIVFLAPGPGEPVVEPAKLSGRVEVKGSLEPVALLEVSLFEATRKPPPEKEEAEEPANESEEAPTAPPVEEASSVAEEAADRPEGDALSSDEDVEASASPPAEEAGEGSEEDAQPDEAGDVAKPADEATEEDEKPRKERPLRPRDFDLVDEPIATVTTADDGSFDFGEVPPGTYVAALGSGGFRLEKFVEVLEEGLEREVLYRIRPTGVPETVVIARSSNDAPERVLTRDQLKKMPGAGRDPMAAIQSLPGVVHTPPQFGAGDQAQVPVLRGASAEDSVLYLDGLPVPIIFHSLSGFSITGDALVDKAYLHPAAVTARYGDLTGGVVGLELRSPRSDRVGGFLDPGVGLFSFGLEGPITKKSRFYVGLRRSYYDVFLKLVIPQDAPIDFATAPFFQDQQIVLEADPTPWLKLGLGYIGTIDGLRLLDSEPDEDEDPLIFDLKTDMHRIYVRADFTNQRGFTNRIHPAITFWGTAFQFTDVFQTSNRHTTFHLFDDMHLPLFKWLSIDAGASLEVDRLRQTQNTPIGIREDTGPRATLSDEENLRGSELDTRTWVGGYISLPVRPVPQLTIAPELRVDWFSSINEFVPQVRARMGVEPHKRVRVSLAGGRYLQAPSSEELSSVTGNPDLGPEGAWHLNLGVKLAPADWIDLDVQGYVKFLDDQAVSSVEAASFASFTEFGDVSGDAEEDPTHGLSNSGVGRIYGMESFIRFGLLRKVGITGWFGYSLSWAERKDFPDEDWRWFQNDRRHQLTALVQLAFPGEVTLGARFQLQSGAPKTPVEDSTFYADFGSYIPEYGGLYTARSKPYHQLDIRLDKKFRRQRTTVEIYIDVQNVYAAKTSDYEYPSFDYREEAAFFSLPTPNFAVRVEF